MPNGKAALGMLSRYNIREADLENIYKVCEKAALEMAEWKDRRYSEIIKEECNSSYESGLAEGERKAEARMKNSETLETICSIIRYGLDGNASAVSGNAEILARKYEDNGDKEAAELIRLDVAKPRPLTTYMEGWWNAFSSNTEKILSKDPSAEETCHDVLRDAGISQREAELWLDTETAGTHPRTSRTVIHYIDTL